MNFKEYLAEKALNDKVYASTIERLGGTAKMGFELEMWIPEESDLLIIDDGDSSRGDYALTAAKAKQSLEDALGVDVTINGDNINDWRIVPDGSIQEGGTGTGIELVSPPTPVDDALGDLKQCFKWMSKHDVVTNSTTGLHVNLSIPGIWTRLDKLKLILFMGEQHVLKKYERELNTYAKAHYADMIDAIQKAGPGPKKASELNAIASKALQDIKYRTVNLSKLKSGYLEFRTAGNANYHKKFESIANDVGRFLTIIELACDPEAERKEYLKKLAKLFDQAKAPFAVAEDMGLEKFLHKFAGQGSYSVLVRNLTGDRGQSKDGWAEAGLFSLVRSIGPELHKGLVPTPRIIAEFKQLLQKAEKFTPDIIEKVKALEKTHQWDSKEKGNTYLKSFLKAFNLK